MATKRTAMVKINAQNAHEFKGKIIMYGYGDTYQQGEVIGCNPGVDNGMGGAVVIGVPATQGWRLASYDDDTLFSNASKYTNGMYAEDTIFTVLEE